MIERNDDDPDQAFDFEIPEATKGDIQSLQKVQEPQNSGLSESMVPLSKTDLEEKGVNLDFI